MKISKLFIIGIIALFLIGTVNATSDSTNETTTNVTVLQNKIKELENKIKELTEKNNNLIKDNIDLTREVNSLKNELNKMKYWDMRQVMANLTIYHITPSGAKFDLIFHEGGLAGVTVYQYVGPWMGDAGKWRQYKQIAQYKTTKGESGYLKPVLELKPVWGFENETIRIRTLKDILRIESKYNSPYGLTLYFMWLRDQWWTASRYNTSKIVGVGVIAIFFGMIFGERVTPIRRLVNRINMYVMTDFGDRKISKKFILFSILLTVSIITMTYTLSMDVIITLIVSVIWLGLYGVILRYMR